ncbi:hypothetical protein [Acetobacter orleanensis]|uniref:Uncharacterized protein n=1 Tax=Acetobacter orleanensis TaxID=104099 RepID=A0A4Y3TLZ7_9PROT|nr:hypothetical protein [Acetobacter orleanensis]KXV62496.1 hypothetical protein AD949_10215 [Acetobacter orleanensis]PCD80073.1 hypothetical protein CO710_04275 [Acetobacter orleanensis]GAN68401.1 hypothetical protein Abol_015_240 [Acetobacter orleanensis JCM 7639]GBR29596.1 hypothetical protein AA0473_2052 [Acetobacter orleanensis NRIC 0473]GEB82753.1 hypothetical protein AOR01nite_12300 [Acetobacter orleanensis]
MLKFRPVFLALTGCLALSAVLPKAEAAPALSSGQIMVPPGPAPMTATTATPGVLDYDGIPTVEHASAENVGGLMYYCYAHHLVTDTTVRTLGRQLAAREGIRANPAYAWGGQGQLMLSPTVMFDITTLNRDQQEAVCSRSALRGPALLAQ